MPLLATISSAPTNDIQPKPAPMRRPAMMEGTAAGKSTSVIVRKFPTPNMLAASRKRISTFLAPR